MDRRAWRTTVRGGCKELETTEYAGTHTMPFYIQYLNICGFCVPKGGFLDPTILLPTRALIWSALQCAEWLVSDSLPGSSVHGDSPGKNTGVGCHALLQIIFPTRGSNRGLRHCRQILYVWASRSLEGPSYIAEH